MKRGIFTLMVLTIILNACSMQKINVALYQSPRLEYPPELRAYLLTSRYVPATGNYEDVQWGAYESVDSIKWALSEAIIDTLGKYLVTGNHFLIKVRHNPRMLKNNTASLPEPQPWEGMQQLATRELVQGIIVLEGFDMVIKPAEIIPDGDKVLARREYEAVLAIRVYEPEKRRQINDSVFTYRYRVDGVGSSAADAIAKLPDSVKGGYLAGSFAARSFAESILPNRVNAERFYYSRGDSLLLVADSAIRKGNWNRAESKWSYLSYKAKDTILMAKASYNMAVACERDGRLNQAIGYARRSDRLNPSPKTKEYIALLENRMKEYQEKIKDGRIVRNW